MKWSLLHLFLISFHNHPTMSLPDGCLDVKFFFGLLEKKHTFFIRPLFFAFKWGFWPGNSGDGVKFFAHFPIMTPASKVFFGKKIS